MTSNRKTALLIVNTGSPETPTKEAVARYLGQFLGDRHVVDKPAILWLPILHGIIIPRRSEASAKRYEKLWTADGSPLVAHTKNTAKALQAVLQETHDVYWAMCYGDTRMKEVLPQILAKGYEELVVMPMFAHQTRETWGAVRDEAAKIVKKCGAKISCKVVKPFFDHEGYIAALAGNVKAHWQKNGALVQGGKLVMSFHGIPVSSARKAKHKPYEEQCRETARLLAEKLGLAAEQFEVCFQSKFGREEWLSPSAIDTVKRLASEGVPQIDVICPGFCADCLETIEEIDEELREIWSEAGGGRFGYVPAPNACDSAVSAYAEMAVSHLQEL